jgi:hypothetical protein
VSAGNAASHDHGPTTPQVAGESLLLTDQHEYSIEFSAEHYRNDLDCGWRGRFNYTRVCKSILCLAYASKRSLFFLRLLPHQ